MPLGEIEHNQRASLIAELHARPFLKLKAPSRLAYIALKPDLDGQHSPQMARTQLTDFLDRYDAPHPDEGAVFYFVSLGDKMLKWENHSEFATYTIFTEAHDGEAFSSDLHAAFAPDWIKSHQGRVVCSVIMDLENAADQASMEVRVNGPMRDWFARTSFAASLVTDAGVAIAADFDLDKAGHTRIALLATDEMGPGRIGRAAQRLLEIETYRAMSMLTLPIARKVLTELSTIDSRLSQVMEAMGTRSQKANESLDELLKISADLAILSSQSSFRFSAARAYEALVTQRIELLSEERLLGRQMIGEFMKRRYAPTMRTCRSAHQQLEELTERAAKASELLGTRVTVATSNQNKELLAKMDRRAEQQARLQETVEGISVVAISYYAVSLLTYLLGPVAKLAGLPKTWLAAALVIPVAALVWFSMHRLKERLIRKPDDSGNSG